MNFPVFDLHCDTASILSPTAEKPILLSENTLHIDLKRAKTLPGYAQCFACFTTTDHCDPPTAEFEKQLTNLLSELYRNKHIIRQAFSVDDIVKNQREGFLSAILTLEGTAGIDFDPELLEDLYKIGFRISSLCWNERNPLVGSHCTGGGLTDRGAAFVQEAQRLGMLIDVSHISDDGFWDIMDITQGPVIATHSNSRTVCNVSRNLTDEMFTEICKTDGVVGINLYTEFLGEHPDLDTVCDHIFHFLQLDPTGQHIALGGDLDGCDTLPAGFSGVSDYSVLAQKLLSRGLEEDSVLNLFWNNALGVISRALHNNSQ